MKKLEQYGIQPSKKLGQNFLNDSGVLRREVAYADIGPEDTVLEIGPGIGNLTELLLGKAAKVIAVEQDRQFSKCLGDLQKQHSHLSLLWGDALRVGLPRFDKVVANLPYHVALPIIFRLLGQRFDRAVLMVQKRLAERMCAGVGENGYCRMGITVGRVAKVDMVEKIRSDAFVPEPDVESAIVKIERGKPNFAVPSEDFFKQVLEALFVHRDESLQRVLEKSRDRNLPPAALAKLGKKLKNKQIFRLTPREFGEITRVMWEVRERKIKR